MTVDLGVRVGPVELKNPVLTAAGTSGHGAELAAYVDLSRLGAVVVKSLATFAWPGNDAPRIAASGAGMLNSVGLQGPGVAAWCGRELAALEAAGARVVASIWGRTEEEFAQAAEQLFAVRDQLAAVEVNVSCPNLEDRSRLFAHSPEATRSVLAATAGCGVPRFAKLSPNVADLVEICAAARAGGAAGVTLVNTLLAIGLDVERARPVLGAGRGGLSGPALRPVALRAVYDCHAALPDLPIIGVGGIMCADDAVAFLMAGASAVEVGTATFANPRATVEVLDGIVRWCRAHGVQRVEDLTGAAHDRP